MPSHLVRYRDHDVVALGDPTVFLSDPTLEIPIPPGLSAPGIRGWRAVRVSLQVPWFIACFEISEDNASVGVTMCFAWDTDLVAAFRTLDHGKLRRLVCMVPPWQSTSANWEAKPVVAIHREVGAAHNDGYVFETSDGTQVTAMQSEPGSAAQRLELVTRIPQSVPTSASAPA